MPSSLPEWCRVRRGAGPILLVAPHGGRRRRRALRAASGRRLKINDLGTAELATTLAEELDASLLANVALDRNELDLNRISAVERDAPWFLDELASLVAHGLARHERIEILVVHGWHVVQAKCDVGIGQRLEGERDPAVDPSRLTVSREFLERRLGGLRARAAERAIRVAFGERYPASHPENLLQIFRRDPGKRRGPAALAEAVDRGRIEAVQLELGVPLRFPGPHRDALVETLVEVFRDDAPHSVAPSGVSRSPAARRPPPGGEGQRGDGTETAYGLRAHDRASGLAIVAGISPNGDGSEGGRLLLIDGDQVVLFTGEERALRDPALALRVGGLAIEPRADGFDARFDGPAVAVDDGDLYLRTEMALGRARLVAVSLEMSFRRGATDVYGAVLGRVTIGERSYDLAAEGFADARFARGVVPGERRHLAFSAAFGPGLGLAARYGGGETPPHVERHDGHGQAMLEADLEELVARRRFEGACLRFADGGRLLARPESRMSILRPIGTREFARISFGVARFALDGAGEGSGFYEYAEAWP